MENKFEHIDEIIARVLAGDAIHDDQQVLEAWLSVSEENKQAFRNSQKIFAQTAALKKRIAVDTDKAWETVKNRMNQNRHQQQVIPIDTFKNRRIILRIAAMVAILAGLGAAGYFLLLPGKTVFDKQFASGKEVRSEILPDGSSIAMNKNTTISYSSKQFGKKRLVKLTGEAFFEVKHDAQHQFIVEAGNLFIEDVGTTFNVKAYPDSKVIIVTVETGEVKIFTTGKRGLDVTAGETATYDPSSGTFTKSVNDDQNLHAYRDKIFIFDNTELQVIVKLLNDIYGGNISIENAEVKKCRLTASFNNEPLDTILSVIAETLQLKIVKSQNGILLDGHACN